MVFISYRHENSDHARRVALFAKTLEESGAQVILDQNFLKENPGGPNEGWHKWCAQQVEKAEQVIIIGSPGWFDALEVHTAPQAGLGAVCEAHIIRTLLYQSGHINNKFRIVRLSTATDFTIPTLLSSYHNFNGEDTNDINQLLSWLKTRHQHPPSSWLSHPPSLEWPFADTFEVRDTFSDMLTETPQYRVLLLSGDSEVGKSRITKHLLKIGLSQSNLSCGRIDLKGGSDLDSELHHFSQYLITPGSSSEIVLGTGSTRDKLRRLSTHVQNRDQPTLIIVDTYDEVQSREFSDWIQKSILLATIRNKALRVIIAGQKIPEHLSEPWATHTKLIRLQAPSCEDWIAFDKTYQKVRDEDFIRKAFQYTEGSASILWQVIGSSSSS